MTESLYSGGGGLQPAKELLLLRCTIPAVDRPLHFAAPPRPHPPTDGQRQRVDDEDRTACKGFAQEIEEVEPVGEAMEATVEAGEGGGEIAEGVQDAQGTFVMIRKLTGGDHCHGHGRLLGSIAIARAGTAIGLMTEGGQAIVKGNETVTIKLSFIGHSSGGGWCQQPHSPVFDR